VLPEVRKQQAEDRERKRSDDAAAESKAIDEMVKRSIRDHGA
jgi:hypothetical protein